MTARPLPPGRVRPASPQPDNQDEQPCEHRDTWFDRAVCPEPCGGMHEHCANCGHTLHGCINDQPAPSAGQDTDSHLPHVIPTEDEAAGQDTERLRDEIARGVPDWCGLTDDEPLRLADALLDGPLRQLIDQRDQERERARQAWAVHSEHVDRMNVLLLQVQAERDEARAQVQRVAEFADELAEDSHNAKRLADEARARDDREMQRINMRHARVAHHAAAELRRALDAP